MLRIGISLLCFGLILGGSSAIGLVIAKNYRERPRHLQSVRAGIDMLSTEIVYAATPLAAALENVSKSMQEPVAEFFSLSGRSIANFVPVRDAWAQGLAHLRESTALIAADLEVIRLLGEVLGTSSREDQERHLLLACRRLQAQNDLAADEAVRNERMWQYLGLLLGVLVVVIMV